MSWIHSLKKIKSALVGGKSAREEQSKKGLAAYTIEQLEGFFSKNTFDRNALEDLLQELKRREEESKKAGKEISPGIYKLRFVVFERIQELEENSTVQEDEVLSTREDDAENGGKGAGEGSDVGVDTRPPLPETITREVVDAAVTAAAEGVTGNQTAHPSEQFSETQFRAGERGGKLEIRIGIDFGTAFTKVVLGTPRGARAVPLASGLQMSNDYLLPGVLSIEKSGDCHLGVMVGCNQIDDLKMKIIDSEGNLQLESQVQVVAYLALLFRRIRWWWINQKGAPEVFRSQRIAWFINSGLPTESMEGAIPSLYRRLILAAWAASVDRGAINVKQIKETCELAAIDQSIITYDDEVQKEYLDEKALELLPEFLAQTAVYISHDSIDTRRLHVMVDIGAGTIDMTIFNVYEWDEVIRHAIYGKKVIPSGVNYLIKNRISYRGKALSLANQFYMEDISDQQFADKIGVRRDRLEEVDRAFLDQVADQFAELRNLVRNDPEISQDTHLLERGIKLFLAGGGARIDAYKKRFRKFARDSRQYRNNFNAIEIGQLPDLGQIEDLERQFVAPGLDRRDYDRLSVAYGLSDDPWNLAELLDEEQIKLLSLRAVERNRATRENAGGAYWDDPNAPPVW